MAETLAGSGVELIQYRNKTAPSRQFFEISRQLSSVLAPRGVRFIVNDRPGHRAAGRRGRRARGTGRPGRGRSARHLRRRALGRSFDSYAGPGDDGGPHFRRLHRFWTDFPTTTKAESGCGCWNGTLAAGAQITAKPLVAIGGITLERAAEVYRAGADSLAVVRDLICATDPGARAREYLEVAASTPSRAAG